MPGQPGAQPPQYQPPASGSQPPRGPSVLGFGIAALRRMGPRQGQAGGRAFRGLVFVGVGAVALVAIIAAVAGSGGGGSNQASASAPVTSARPAASSARSQASSLSGPIGTVYQAVDESGNKMTVELTRIIDPAHAASQFTAPGNGKRSAGAVTFQIPAGLKVARIQWSVDGVGASPPAQWVIHS
jgi:hypothetical protein